MRRKYKKKRGPVNSKKITVDGITFASGLEYIIDECIDAGIKEIIFVISKKKEIIRKYFRN